MAYTGTRNCPPFQDAVVSPEIGADAGTTLRIANHHVLNSYVPRDSEAILDEKGELNLAVAKKMAEREQAWIHISAEFVNPNSVYWALVSTVERDCSGQCATCPMLEADLTPKS